VARGNVSAQSAWRRVARDAVTSALPVVIALPLAIEMAGTKRSRNAIFTPLRVARSPNSPRTRGEVAQRRRMCTLQALCPPHGLGRHAGVLKQSRRVSRISLQ
jgi:hypothetical protein